MPEDIKFPDSPITPRQQSRLDAAELAAAGVEEELEERATGTLDDDIDPEEPVEPSEPGKKLSAAEQREKDIEDMARRRREHLSREEVDEEDDDTVQSGEVQTDSALKPGEAQENTEPQTSAPQDVTPGFYVNEAGEHRYRTVVNGQPLDVSADEAFQRLAAENAQLRQSRQAPVQQQQPTNSQQPPAEDAVNVELADLRAKRKDAYSRMFNGDETAIDDLSQLDDRISELTVKQAQSIDVVGKLTEYQTTQRRQAWSSRVAADEQALMADPAFKAVTANPAAYILATQEAARIMRETNAIDNGVAPIDVMRQAVTNVMGIMGAAPAPQVDTRQQRKQQIGNTAVSAGAAAQNKQRLAQPEPTPDGGATPQQQRRAALAELRKVKGERD